MVKAGDVVVLRSGGQPMTVIEARGEDAVCVWMGEEGDLFRDTLPIVALDLVEAEEEDEDEEDADTDAEDEGDEDESEEDEDDKAEKAA